VGRIGENTYSRAMDSVACHTNKNTSSSNSAGEAMGDVKILLNMTDKVNLKTDFYNQKFSPSQTLAFYKLLQKLEPRLEGLMRLPSGREIVEQIANRNCFDIVTVRDILNKHSATHALTNEFRVLLDTQGKIPEAAFDLNSSNQFLLLKNDIEKKLSDSGQPLRQGALAMATSLSLQIR